MNAVVQDIQQEFHHGLHCVLVIDIVVFMCGVGVSLLQGSILLSTRYVVV